MELIIVLRLARRARTALIVAAAAGFLLAPGRASAEAVYFTPRAVLSDFFPRSERVTYRTFVIEPTLRGRLARRLGYTPPKDRYTVFVATTQGRVDGYAVIDDEKGEHQPITFATRLSPTGVIERIEIMVYREPRGDEVRDARFRRQFQGKTAQSPLRIKEDVDAVSGATISSASIAAGARRAAVLVEELALAASPAGPSAMAVAPAEASAGAR